MKLLQSVKKLEDEIFSFVSGEFFCRFVNLGEHFRRVRRRGVNQQQLIDPSPSEGDTSKTLEALVDASCRSADPAQKLHSKRRIAGGLAVRDVLGQPVAQGRREAGAVVSADDLVDLGADRIVLRVLGALLLVCVLAEDGDDGEMVARVCEADLLCRPSLLVGGENVAPGCLIASLGHGACCEVERHWDRNEQLSLLLVVTATCF